MFTTTTQYQTPADAMSPASVCLEVYRAKEADLSNQLTLAEKKHKLAKKEAAAASDALAGMPSWDVTWNDALCYAHADAQERWSYELRSGYLGDVKRFYDINAGNKRDLVQKTKVAEVEARKAFKDAFDEYAVAHRMFVRCKAKIVEEAKEDARKAAAEFAAKINAFPFIQYYSYQFFTGLKIF
jgi:hypothetical protein